jgi:putative hydrolase of the HAD superfamily
MSSHETEAASIEAIFWDFGGVFTTSPFLAFNTYEASIGIPKDFIRTVNATNSDTNAWAKLERNEITIAEFGSLFEEEAIARGVSLDGQAVLSCIEGKFRPEMVTALEILTKKYKTACLTNNFGPSNETSNSGKMRKSIMKLFDTVVESQKIGIRKPEPRFYLHACDTLNVTPTRVIFLDDLGVNLKPARQLGMHTIKVFSSSQALSELETHLGHRIG